MVLGAAAALIALTRTPVTPKPSDTASPHTPSIRFPVLILWSCGLVLFLALVPSHRWSGASLGGDEPKYLRMAESLYHDLDVDVASETQQPLDAHLLRRNVASFAGAIRDALGELFVADAESEARSTHHNWTIEGRLGGRYYVQSAGLPILLFPAVTLQRALAPTRHEPWLPMLILGALWATALAQTFQLCLEAGAPRGPALLAASAALLAPPLLIGGMHFYPESAALPAIAWIARFARPGGPLPGRPRAVALAIALGALPWLHPKLIPVAAVLAVLLAARLRADRKTLLLALAAGLVPVVGLLLFDHHVTGLASPDSFYRVYGSEVYAGLGALVSPSLVTGFVNGLFAARDGLLVMAPILIAAVLALPILWRRDRRTALALAAIFGAIWFAAAVHEGGAPGPPARLMAPAATLLTVPLALALGELKHSLPYRWTAVALAVITLSLTWSFRSDWLRTTNPYRSIAAETNFAPDLPDGPRNLELSPPESRRLPDIIRALILAAVLALWSKVLSRPSPHPTVPEDAQSLWRLIRNTHLAWWTTIATLAWCLHALP